MSGKTSDSDKGAKPKPRTAAQIEADLEARRVELANTVDALTAQLDPRENLTALKAQLAETAANATDEAQEFVARLQQGDRSATLAVGGVITLAIGLVGIILIRCSR